MVTRKVVLDVEQKHLSDLGASGLSSNLVGRDVFDQARVVPSSLLMDASYSCTKQSKAPRVLQHGDASLVYHLAYSSVRTTAAAFDFWR